MKLAPGIHDLPERVYHADPCPAPSLSSSVARLLVRRSPLHAWHAHPRLNTKREPENPTDEMEWGSIVHRLVFGQGPDIVEVDADDWRTKAAKEQRQDARDRGALPVLPHKLAELTRCATAAVEQLAAFPDLAASLRAGRAGQTAIAREDDIWMRALVDWLPDDPAAPLIDLKSTTASAAPADWERRLITEYAIQAAFYVRTVGGARGVRPDGMHFAVVEMEAPYALSVVSPAPSLLAVAEDEVEEALDLWADCLKRDRWPGYPPLIAWVEAPAWALQGMEERHMRRAFQRAHGPAGEREHIAEDGARMALGLSPLGTCR